MNETHAEAPVPLVVVGCDFRVASSRWRSRLVLSADEALELTEALRRTDAADGFADLNTCNRNEWLVSTEQPEWVGELLRAQMKQRIGLDEAPWFEPYAYHGAAAVDHVLRVAVGLESLIVGERQIAGQLQHALENARERGTSSRVLNGLGAAAGRLVRASLRRGCLSGAGVGVHSLSLRFLEQQLAGRERSDVLVVGLGSIGRQVAAMFDIAPAFRTLRCNRTIAPEQADRVHPLATLPELLREVDAAVLCTGAPYPILTPDDLPARSPERPLTVVDIGIPEQGPRGALAENVTLVGLDELVAFHLGERSDDLRPVCECERQVDFSLGEFRTFCGQPAYAGILDTVHRQHGHFVKEDLPAAVAELPDDVRGRVAEELRERIRDYTSEVLRSIRSQSDGPGDS